MKISDQQRKAMYARLDQHVKDQNYDGLKRWHETNVNQHGKDVAEAKLIRTFTKYDKKIKEHGSLKAWSEDQTKKRGEAYDRAGVKRRKESEDRWQKKTIERYGSIENYVKHYNANVRKKVARIKEVKENPKLAQEVSRKYALTGSKYYKLDGDSIHCPNCSQRLGNMIDRCPVCHTHGGHIYGRMLNNPADPRWREPRYSRNRFHPSESSGEYALKERMKSGGDLSDLK